MEKCNAEMEVEVEAKIMAKNTEAARASNENVAGDEMILEEAGVIEEEMGFRKEKEERWNGLD